MNIIGLDIGTTTICGVAVNSADGSILKTVTVENNSFIDGKPFEKIQSPEKIIEKVTALAEELSAQFNPGAVGITGQMHGIVYLDKNGSAVSPLYTWQDGSGNRPCGGTNFADKLTGFTGYKAASGFGTTTYFFHKSTDNVPKAAVTFCTIHDYAAMVLTGRKTPLVHASDAASFGLFNLKNRSFDKAAIEKAGLDFEMFPEVTSELVPVGEYRGALVCTAIGDNQASFIGSLKNIQTGALVNMGTGGQISMLSALENAPMGMELRPLTGDKNILVGCSLCGGRAFAVLAEFFQKCVEMVGGKAPENIYKYMDALLAKADVCDDPLVVTTTLCGTRDEPALRGKIENLGAENLTPQSLMNGFLSGMVKELTDMIKPTGCKVTELVGSGNGLRKNLPLQERFSDAFGTKMLIPAHREEAAFGAVLAAAVACGDKADLNAALQLISYQ